MGVDHLCQVDKRALASVLRRVRCNTFLSLTLAIKNITQCNHNATNSCTSNSKWSLAKLKSKLRECDEDIHLYLFSIWTLIYVYVIGLAKWVWPKPFLFRVFVFCYLNLVCCVNESIDDCIKYLVLVAKVFSLQLFFFSFFYCFLFLPPLSLIFFFPAKSFSHSPLGVSIGAASNWYQNQNLDNA